MVKKLDAIKIYEIAESSNTDLGIFQSLKLRISMEKVLLISLKLNFTPSNLGCYGLK